MCNSHLPWFRSANQRESLSLLFWITSCRKIDCSFALGSPPRINDALLQSVSLATITPPRCGDFTPATACDRRSHGAAVTCEDSSRPLASTGLAAAARAIDGSDP